MGVGDGNNDYGGGGGDGGDDWWSQNGPPAASGPTFDQVNADYQRYLHRALSQGEYDQYWKNASNYNASMVSNSAEGIAYQNSIYGTGGTAGTKPDPNATWDPKTESWVLPSSTPKPPPGGDPSKPPGTLGVPTSGFGAPAPDYHSDPNAPSYDALPDWVPPTWTGGDFVNPTEQDLLNSPGYQARLDTLIKGRERASASQGTILNGGTLKALDRAGQEYATGEYQTLRSNALENYRQRYSQFQDAAGMSLAARTANANEHQNVFANRLNLYNTGNARTLSDYITNLNKTRNNELDYWNRLKDLSGTGSGLAGNSR